MASIRVEVRAAHIAEAGPDHGGWAFPVEAAIAELVGVRVAAIDIDGDQSGYSATIGTHGATTLVVELPEVADDWLDARWESDERIRASVPFAFDLYLDDWLVALVAKAATTLEQAAAVDRLEGRL